MSGLFTRAAHWLLVTGAVLTVSFTQASAEQPEENDAFTVVASDSELSESRGAFLPDTLNLTTVDQVAQDSHNSVIGGVTGMNSIAGNGITNSSGLINVIQNSGNNVVIQNSTVVNLTFSK